MEMSENSRSIRSFWFGKIFSLFGLIPLGIYVVVHLYNNLTSLGGEEAFNHHLQQSRSLPLIVPITILVIWIPILFHGLYGLFGMKKSRPVWGRAPFFRNFKYILQRLSGIGLLLFIPAHVYKTRIEPSLEGSTVDFHHMAEGLHEPLTLAVYIFGVLGVSYHLANGIWQFGMGWGLTTREAGIRRMERISYVVFVLVAAMGAGAIWGFFK